MLILNIGEVEKINISPRSIKSVDRNGRAGSSPAFGIGDCTVPTKSSDF